MSSITSKVTLAALTLFGPLTGAALAKPAESDTVSTKPTPSMQTQLLQQQQHIEAQDAKIEELEQQLHDVTAILQNRVERVEAATDSGKVIDTAPGPRIEGPNARNSFNFVGTVQATFSGVQESKASNSTAPEVHSGTEIKRARLGVQGVAYSDFAYAAEVDIATTSGSISNASKDLWVQYNGFRPFAVTIGNMKPQNGLEASFSDRSNANTFIESSMLTSMYQAPGTRNIGVRVSTGGAHWSTSWGLFGDDVNNNAIASQGGEGWGVHGRLTYAPIATPTDLLHFGVSGYSRKVAEDATNVSQIRLRAQPDDTVDPARLIDTGNLANAHYIRLAALEAIGMHGPFGFQSEVGRSFIDRIGTNHPDLTFDGAYLNANWVLTGESRVYDPRTGVITRFAPRVNVDPANGTWGAWELAARWDTLDLNSHENDFLGPTLLGIRGGKETNYTAGLNWYWNPYFRMMLNYVHADAEKRSATNVDQGARLDELSLRVAQEW